MILLLLVAIAVIVWLAYRLSRRDDDGSLAQSQHYAAWAAARIHQLEAHIHEMEQGRTADLDKRAARAVAASRGGYDGHAAEQAFPAAPHPYHPKDIFHLGGVVDYIVFDGLHDVRHEGRDPKTLNVVLVDVKWGSSRTSEVQKAVLEAVAEGRTRAETWHARQSSTGTLDYSRRELR